ncbi:MAG: hypothetical protein J6O54_06605 [Prevotella sp.]|nr:hypothetical protein [Prevotella sp.]
MTIFRRTIPAGLVVRSVFVLLVGRSRCGRELQTRYSCVASVSVASWWCPSCGNISVAVSSGSCATPASSRCQPARTVSSTIIHPFFSILLISATKVILFFDFSTIF